MRNQVTRRLPERPSRSCGRRPRSGSQYAAAALALLASFVAASPACAGSFEVNPVRITLSPDRRVTSLTIKNSDPNPVSVRIVTYRWTQADGRDVYSPTTDVIASPPIFTLSQGGTQLVRIGLRNQGTGAYRVVLEEIPRQQASNSPVQMLLQLNLPLYLVPKGGGAIALAWKAWRDGAGDLFVEANNSGSLHAQIIEIGANEAGKHTILSQQTGVILPSSTRRWKIGKQPGFMAGSPMTLTIRSSAGETQTNILVERR